MSLLFCHAQCSIKELIWPFFYSIFITVSSEICIVHTHTQTLFTCSLKPDLFFVFWKRTFCYFLLIFSANEENLNNLCKKQKKMNDQVFVRIFRHNFRGDSFYVSFFFTAKLLLFSCCCDSVLFNMLLCWFYSVCCCWVLFFCCCSSFVFEFLSFSFYHYFTHRQS